MAPQIASRQRRDCARLLEGRVSRWGNNEFGQLGDGRTTDRTAPVTVRGVADAAYVAVGQHHSCALITDGSVVCCGRNNHGQLGDGSLVDRPTPGPVAGL